MSKTLSYLSGPHQSKNKIDEDHKRNIDVWRYRLSIIISFSAVYQVWDLKKNENFLTYEQLSIMRNLGTKILNLEGLFIIFSA